MLNASLQGHTHIHALTHTSTHSHFHKLTHTYTLTHTHTHTCIDSSTEGLREGRGRVIGSSSHNAHPPNSAATSSNPWTNMIPPTQGTNDNTHVQTTITSTHTQEDLSWRLVREQQDAGKRVAYILCMCGYLYVYVYEYMCTMSLPLP